MHIRCKFDGGKQINKSQSGSWQHVVLVQGFGLTKGQLGNHTYGNRYYLHHHQIHSSLHVWLLWNKSQRIGKEKQPVKPKLTGNELDTIVLIIV